jgi:predicted DNA-binding protein (MmcQ/YjbR family)
MNRLTRGQRPARTPSRLFKQALPASGFDLSDTFRTIHFVVHERLDERPWLHLLTPLREICLALPEANETINFGHPWFRAGKKVFAIFGLGDDRPGVSFRADPMARELLLDDARFVPTPYMHHNGWLTLRLEAAVDWDEVEELVVDSYRQQALKRMVRALDSQV